MAERFADMFIDPEEDPRADAPLTGDESDVLVGFLKWQRDTLKLKCAGLDAEDLARKAVPTSNLSLLGLVRHMAEVERSWFRAHGRGVRPPQRPCRPVARGDRRPGRAVATG